LRNRSLKKSTRVEPWWQLLEKLGKIIESYKSMDSGSLIGAEDKLRGNDG
jgi:hypothetical protein